MTTLLDAPATTRREKTMLKRKMAATTEPETTTAIDLPAVEQASASVVTDDTNLGQAAELVTDTSAEPVTETSEHEPVVSPEPVVIEEAVTVPEPDDDDEFPVTKPQTGGFPMLGFKPVRKDMSDDDDDVPYAPPMPTINFFDEDESGFANDQFHLLVTSEEELNRHADGLIAGMVATTPAREAEEKARKEKEAKEEAEAEAERVAHLAKRESRRVLGTVMGIVMLGAGTLSAIYGIIVPYLP